MSDDCTGEPPGELISNTTALRSRTLKARSSGAASVRIFSCEGLKPARPLAMMPSMRTTLTTGPVLRKRFGRSRCNGLRYAHGVPNSDTNVYLI